jgi:hypothetical protein
MRSPILRALNSDHRKNVAIDQIGRRFAILTAMLMLSIIRHHERLVIRLKGRLEGSSAEDLRLAACPPSALNIDLSRMPPSTERANGRFSNAVKQMLLAGGVTSTNIKAISYGKEKPACDEHDESCWQQAT